MAIAAALLLAACVQASDRGARSGSPRPTIVSLNPCADAILVAVADPGQIAALSHFSRDPRASSLPRAVAARFPATSGTIEEVVALRPDVVVGDAFTPGPAGRAAMERLGLRLESFSIEPDVATSRAQVRRLATLAGHPQRGEALVARIDAALARAAPPPGHEPVAAVVWQGGGIVPGERTLIAELLRRTGYRSLSEARGLGQADVLPLERMLADPPRVIFAAGSPGDGGDRMLAHPALAALAGTTRVRLPPQLLWCGGLTIPRTVARLAAARQSLDGGGETQR